MWCVLLMFLLLFHLNNFVIVRLTQSFIYKNFMWYDSHLECRIISYLHVQSRLKSKCCLFSSRCQMSISNRSWYRSEGGWIDISLMSFDWIISQLWKMSVLNFVNFKFQTWESSGKTSAASDSPTPSRYKLVMNILLAMEDDNDKVQK